MDPLLEGYGRATLLTGDFDGDGRADIAQTPEDRVIVAYGLGLGAFTAPVKIESGYVFALYAAADLDLDGIDDLLFGEFGPAWWQPWVTMGLYGNSNRTLDSRRLSIQQTFSDVVVADFDGDGKPDLAGVGNYELSILTGNGRRDFVPQLDYAMGYAAHIAPGDFNGDGRVDIACAFEHEPILSILLRR
jgi:hypothetical protein